MINYSAGQKYIVLAFAADNLFGKGKIVDAYYGDQVLSQNVPQLTINELKYNLNKLVDRIEDEIEDIYPYFNKTFLKKQTIALAALVDIYSGSNISYRDALKIILDIEPVDPDNYRIEYLKSSVNDLLKMNGYNGSLHEMLNQWNKDNLISSESYLNNVRELSRKFSEKTYELIKRYILSEDDVLYLSSKDVLNFEMITTEESWSAYNYYDRNYCGKVTFNKSREFGRYSAQTFVAHEAYPGHHTSCLIRELLVNQSKLNEGASIHLLGTPECTIAEGIGDFSINFLNIPNSSIDFQIERLVDELSAEVDYLAAIKIFEENKNDSEIIQLFINDKLMRDESTASRSLRFVKNWGYYVPSYKYGRKIVGDLYKKYNTSIFKTIYGACCPTILTKQFS